MRVLGRRAFLAGSALVGCSSTATGLPSFVSPADARDHWTARFFGQPPTAMLALRFIAPKPRELSPLFKGWRPPGIETDPPSMERQVMPFGYSALKQCPDAEFFAAPDGAMLAVLRGVPAALDPFVLRCRQDNGDLCARRMPDFKLIGTSGSGVMQASIVDRLYGGDEGRLFHLPDGTWAFAKGLPALRLADALARDPRLPPSEHLEPTALVAQLNTVTNVGPFTRGKLLGADQIIAMTSLALRAAPGTPVPVAWRIHTRSGDAARMIAEDLGRIFARSRDERERDWERFPVTSSISIEGTSVVARGTMPFDEIAEWAG